MPTFSLPIGIVIPSLKTDINDRCYNGGPFRHDIDHQLARLRMPESAERGRFKLTQMVYHYTESLMHQFPELQTKVSHATLAEQILEALIASPLDASQG